MTSDFPTDSEVGEQNVREYWRRQAERRGETEFEYVRLSVMEEK